MTTPTDTLRREANRFAHALEITDEANLAEAIAARYRMLLDESCDPISYLDRDGRFLFISRQGAENLGDRPENIVGRTVHDFFPKADADEYVARCRTVIDSQTARIIEDFVHLPDGGRWFWSVLNPFNAADGSPLGVQVLSHEITDEKQARRDLEERLSFEQLIGEVTSRLVDISDCQADATVNGVLCSIGKFMQVDRSLLFQFSRDFSHLSCTHEWHTASVEPVAARLQNQSNEQFPWIFQQFLSGNSVVITDTEALPAVATPEREALLANGVRAMFAVPVRVGGRTTGVLCFDVLHKVRDWPNSLIPRIESVGRMLFTVLARIETERELQESRRFAQAVSEATPSIVYLFDISEARVVYMSSQVERDLGRTPQQVYAMAPAEALQLLHPDDLARFPAMIARWNDADADSSSEELLRLRHADGSWRWFATRDRVFRYNPDGTPSQLIGTMRDVTEQVRAEEELQEHREKLVHVARLSSMGELVAGIAHELGQPLYSIQNFSKAARNVLRARQDPGLEETHDWIEHVERASLRAGDILRRFRDFTRRSETKRTLLDVREVVSDAIELLAFELRGKKVQVRSQLGETPLLAKADRVQLLQTVVNLLQNATDAMTDSPEDARVVDLKAAIQSSEIEISLADRGVGLPEDIEKLFESFVTTKPDGLGIGLAISRAILESHGGQLSAEANPGGGAVFRCRLPVAHEEVADEC